ncbi:D-glycerate dehydrogenase [Candidatus Uhrbacteria bacterium]|nr:D-glycerate dehydrogenase [Candidatus Uhrbacteria bacterium]
MLKVFITRQIPDQGIKMLKSKGYKVSIYPKDEIIPRAALLKGVKGVDAILCDLTEKIDAQLLKDAGPQLKIVANYAVGYDNIDLKAASARKVYVSNTPGVLTDAVAEHAIALMFAIARRICEADRFTRSGKYKGWGPMLLLGTELKGKTLGIVGLGRIGAAVASRAAKGLDMKVVYNNPKPDPDFEKQFGAKYRKNLNDLLKEADFVTLHVPLLPTTRHLISKKQFALMNPNAFLINTARGPVVDEKALLHALKNKTIAGAALDVFECEPLIDCDIHDHLALKNFENVILTPHIASATIEARQAMSRIAAENIIAALSGKTPPNLVQG